MPPKADPYATPGHRRIDIILFAVAVAIVAILLSTSARGADQYWDTANSNGLQGGPGTWSTSQAFWNTLAAPANGRVAWTNGNNAFFQTSAAGSTVTVSGTVSASSITFNGTGYTVAGSTLTLSGPNITANQAATVSAPLAGTAGLTKLGTATLTLSGTGSTYSGTTRINAGTLLVSNTSGSGTGTGNVAVNNAGTLGGTGALTGAVTVASGGTLNPGATGTAGTAAAVGTFRTGALTLQAGSFSNFDVSATSTYDKLISSAQLAFGGTLNVTIASGLTFNSGDILTLFTGTSVLANSVFTGIADGQVVNFSGYNFTADYTATGFNLVAAVPEPSTWAAAALSLVFAGFIQRCRLKKRLKRA